MNDITYTGDSLAAQTQNFGQQMLLLVELWGPHSLSALIILSLDG